ncbi:hypothetical protein, partial [Sedimentibacter sp.]
MSKINKKLKYIRLFMITASILILTSCAEQEDEVVNIWYYEYEFNPNGGIIEKAIEYMDRFAEINDINIEVSKYSYKDMSFDDYVLKRNLAIEHG